MIQNIWTNASKKQKKENPVVYTGVFSISSQRHDRPANHINDNQSKERHQRKHYPNDAYERGVHLEKLGEPAAHPGDYFIVP